MKIFRYWNMHEHYFTSYQNNSICRRDKPNEEVETKMFF